MLILIGIIFFGAAIWGGLLLERKKFYRRNGAGVEEFENYGAMMKIKFKEGALKAGAVLIGLAGFGFMFAGLIALTK